MEEPLDADEWAHLSEELYPRVYRALVAVGASPPDAADAIQDAFERASKRVRPLERAEGWLFVVALRRWRATLWRRRIFRPLQDAPPRGSFDDPSARIDILDALATLTQRQREVIVARYVVGLSQQETAIALGIAQGTVAATSHQAAARLRQLLEETVK